MNSKKTQKKNKYCIKPDPFPSVGIPFQESIDELIKLNPGILRQTKRKKKGK